MQCLSRNHYSEKTQEENCSLIQFCPNSLEPRSSHPEFRSSVVKPKELNMKWTKTGPRLKWAPMLDRCLEEPFRPISMVYSNLKKKKKAAF